MLPSRTPATGESERDDAYLESSAIVTVSLLPSAARTPVQGHHILLK